MHAIERLYRSRYPAFRNVAASITGGHESGREAVQEAFARAWERRAQVRDERALEAWVWRIVIRTAMERRYGREVPLDEVDPVVVDAERDPALADALRALPPRRRLIIFLRYFAGLSYSEIAAACGIAEGTVAAALAQARDELEHALREEVTR